MPTRNRPLLNYITSARTLRNAAASLSVVGSLVLSVLPASANERGLASWYGPGYVGNRTASGEVFTSSQRTAAHRTLPFGTRVRVVNTNTGRSTVVRINDRGPFLSGRVIDLSEAAAHDVGAVSAGLVPVVLQILPN
ncbi:septal ring lytic transglycosylase RlpA family protein [Vulcanococcus sp.]|uniref:septal ring lytic transglycosylase RlpA family protein n=1 Tax=Vulcanococcus sp. TaxID=2856995 RepID=UPI003C0EE921